MLTRIAKDESWKDEAACRDMDPDLFFPTRGDNGHRAKAVCATCPVRDACLAYAMTAPVERFGVFGGLTERQRQRRRTEQYRHLATTTNVTEEAS